MKRLKLNDAVREVSGIGPKREAALKAGGIATVGDLIAHYPRKYIDRSVMGKLGAPTEGDATVKAAVDKKGAVSHIRRNLSLFVLSVTDEDGTTGRITFFNQPWLHNAFEVDKTYYFFGRVSYKKNKAAMANPKFASADDPKDFFDLTPVYSDVGEVSGDVIHRTVQKILAQGLDETDVPEILPKRLLDAYDLPGRMESITLLHLPKDMHDVARGQKRLKFVEALKLNLGLAQNRTHNMPSTIVLRHPASLDAFERGLPFKLTSGQEKVLGEILNDLQSGRVMNRLIQGDVGSGKTIVAVACAYLMAMSGYQSAYMAPTEILAEQHAANFERFLKPYGITVTLVTGSMNPKARERALEHIANGDAQVIIGTHALFQKDVVYYNLGLVMTDEQHRFGVKQRGELALKGERPHTLVMSATPIPRTLSLVLYGDLDISVIDTMPQGRKPVKTYFYTEKAMPKIFGFMAKEMAKGHQCFVVCPFIEDSDDEAMAGVRDTKSVYREINQYYKKLFRVGLLHGQMKSETKAQIIEKFNTGKIDLLVATSIIEVGIDVPNVTVMVIMSAERFGLSQLHQLRGRVGRGDDQAYCFLVSNVVTDKTVERMKVIVNYHDGQKIAEEDFRLRGPGDAFGVRQHGLPMLSALDPVKDAPLITKTRDVADELLASGKAEDMTCAAALTAAFDKDVAAISMN